MNFAIIGQGGLELDHFINYFFQVEKTVTPLTHLFDRSDYIRMAEYAGDGLLIQVEENIVDFLDIILQTRPNASLVVRYEEVRDNAWMEIWSYLWRTMPIIHFKRRNFLDLYVNQVKLKAKTPFYLDGEILENGIKQLIALQEEHDKIIRQGKIFEVFHEDFLRNPQSEINKLEEKLGLPQTNKELHIESYFESSKDLVENYYELKTAFASKQLSAYFE